MAYTTPFQEWGFKVRPVGLHKLKHSEAPSHLLFISFFFSPLTTRKSHFGAFDLGECTQLGRKWEEALVSSCWPASFWKSCSVEFWRYRKCLCHLCEICGVILKCKSRGEIIKIKSSQNRSRRRFQKTEQSFQEWNYMTDIGVPKRMLKFRKPLLQLCHVTNLLSVCTFEAF